MGKKSSSSAPDVDPRVGEAMLKQADLANRQQNWFEKELYPTLLKQTNLQNKWSAQDRELALQNSEWWRNYTQEQTDRLNQRSDEFYNRWQEQYKPIEDQMIQQAKEYNSAAEAERQAQLAIGDSRTAYNAQMAANNMRMQSYGVNPTAGAYQAQNRSGSIQQAAIEAAAANQARNAARELGWQKMAQVSALGQNYIGNSLNASNVSNSAAGTGGSLGQSALGQASAFGQLGAQNIQGLANTTMQNYNGLQSAWGNYGNLAMQSSNYNLSAWQTNQQSASSAAQGAGALVGTIGTVAAAF